MYKKKALRKSQPIGTEYFRAVTDTTNRIFSFTFSAEVKTEVKSESKLSNSLETQSVSEATKRRI